MSIVYTAKQREAYAVLVNPSKRRILLDGGGRSGKTTLIWDWMWQRALYYPGSRHLILRKARSHCEAAIWQETIFKYLAEHVDPTHKSVYNLNKEDLRVDLANRSQIICDGIDDESRVRRIFGREYATIWFNEASEFTWGVVENLFSRAAQKSLVDERGKGLLGPYGIPLQDELPVKIVFDTNPRGKRHWLYKAGIMNIHPESGEPLRDAHVWARVGGWTPHDNKGNISESTLDTYDAMAGVTRRRLLDGEWCENEGAVYNEFDENLHVCRHCDGNKCPELCPRVWGSDKYGQNRLIPNSVVRGIDFGYRDPFVCLWAAPIGETLLFYKCHYRKNMIVSDHARVIKRMTPMGERVRWTVADHDAEDAATLRKEGVRTRPAKKDRPIMAGVDRVKKRLRVMNGVPGMQICKFCTPMLDEISSYMMDPNSDRDMPEGKNDHTMDTMRYIIAEIDGRNTSMAVPL